MFRHEVGAECKFGSFDPDLLDFARQAQEHRRIPMATRRNVKVFEQRELLQVKARQRRAKILRMAREVLAIEGYPNFKLRTVAQRTGISLGNLQYYFPTKHALVHALIDENNASYDRQFKRLFQRVPEDPRSRLLAVVDFLVCDLRKPLVRGFFFQFWALASHDSYVEECIEMTYSHYRGVLASLLRELNRGLSEAELSRRAAAIQSLIEGSTLTLLKSGKSLRHPPGLQSLILEVSLHIAEAPPAR